MLAFMFDFFFFKVYSQRKILHEPSLCVQGLEVLQLVIREQFKLENIKDLYFLKVINEMTFPQISQFGCDVAFFFLFFLNLILLR